MKKKKGQGPAIDKINNTQQLAQKSILSKFGNFF